MFRMNGSALLYNHPNPPEDFMKLSDELYIGEERDFAALVPYFAVYSKMLC